MSARQLSSSRPKASFSTPRPKPHFWIACWTSSSRQSCCSSAALRGTTALTHVHQRFRSSMDERLRDLRAGQARGSWVKARQPAASGRWRCVFLDLEQRFEDADDTPLNGFDVINRSSRAHANTVRAAVSHTSLTVRALRLAVTSCRDQSRASSSVNPLCFSFLRSFPATSLRPQLRRRRIRSWQYNHGRADSNAAVEVLDVLVGQTNAAGGHKAADG